MKRAILIGDSLYRPIDNLAYYVAKQHEVMPYHTKCHNCCYYGNDSSLKVFSFPGLDTNNLLTKRRYGRTSIEILNKILIEESFSGILIIGVGTNDQKIFENKLKAVEKIKLG